MAVTVEPAATRDIDDMLRLMSRLAAEHAELDEYFLPGEDWLEALEVMFLDRIGRRDHFLAVARDGKRVVGMVTASLQTTPVFRRRPRAIIENLIVEPDHRRQGLGRQLVEAAWAWCQTKRVAYVELMVATDNLPGRRFWERCGFEPVMLRLQRRGEGFDGNR